MKNIKLEFDRDYGCNERTGWSIIVNGSFCAELEKHLIVAIIKAFYCYWFVWEKEYR